MSIRFSNLLDVEKYFLGELVYVNPPGEMRFEISKATPMPLDAFLKRIRAYASSGKYPAMQTGSFSRRIDRLQTVLERSENLKDVVLSGYINDNFGQNGNTKNRWKTSLVAMAFRDGEGNGAVSVSGCEMYLFSSAFLDWSGCALAFVGIVTPHHRRALRFFDEETSDLPGEKGVIGHSKGGNVATYIFINRLKENLNAYCINAQPYCWPAMTKGQRAALKSDRYEYIVHVQDFAKKFGYVSYISRTVPLNRYVKAGGLTSHEFSEVRFDELGNLEGDRVLRETQSGLKQKVFGDYAAEKRHSHEESLALFLEQMQFISSAPRLLSVGLEEILLTVGAQAGTLWIRDEDGEGPYIYPYIVKGPASEGLYRLKLRPGGGIAARSAFDGALLLTGEAAQSPDFLPGVDRSTGFQTKAMLTVPLGGGEVRLGSLQILNKPGGFDQDDLRLAAAMADCMAQVFSAKGGRVSGVREFRLLWVYGPEGERFSIEQNQCRVIAAAPEEAARQKDMLMGLSLKPGEKLIFNRKVFDASMQEGLLRMRDQDISLLELAGRKDLNRAEAETALSAAMEKRPMLIIADISGAENSEGGLALTSTLRRLCQERTATAIIFQ